MSITHNKNLNPLLNLLINYIYAKSAPQILSVKGECTFLLLNFLMIGNCSVNSLLEIVLFLIVPPEFLLSKKLWNIEASPRRYQSYFGFLAILNVLSRNTLSAAVLLFKSLRSP